MNDWLTREEALAHLGVKPQTLYAYVSRGLIQRAALPEDSRQSLYLAADVISLKNKQKRGRGAAAIAASALSWGEPTLPTSISTASHGRLIYRGKDAVELSRHATYEEVAALLWGIDQCVFPEAPVGDGPFQALSGAAQSARSILGRPVAKLAEEGAKAVSSLAASIGATGAKSMHQRIQNAWGLDEAGGDRIRRLLVLMADHELNASTFAARIAASTGASVPACLLAGLAVLSGPKHGKAGQALQSLVAECTEAGTEQAVERWLTLGGPMPGFDHPLYPSGDPRASELLRLFDPDPAMAEMRDVVLDTTGHLPNIDFAIQSIARLDGWPIEGSFNLFAIARSAGWIAHVIEQVGSGELIRPRAIYRG